MGFMDQLRKLTQPYDDEDDFLEDSDISLKQAAQSAQPSSIQEEFENAFAGEASQSPEPAAKKAPKFMGEGGIFGGVSHKRSERPVKQPKTPHREKVVNFGGSDTQVILFNPKSFEEAGELLSHLEQSRSVVMTLEGLPTDTARRLLDFLSGITFAMQGKITPVSGKTYFITPQNVDILASQPSQAESDEQYF